MSNAWKPIHIDAEMEFTQFVRGFRDGATVEDYLKIIPHGVLNADFIFKADQVVAELKCLEKDAGNSAELARRFFASAKHFGHSNQEIESFIYRQKEIPERVKMRFSGMMRRPITEACKKAIKQIKVTKSLVAMPDARGLILIANDNNYGLSPHEMMMTISDCINRYGRGVVDVAVYFTPNVYHDDNSGDGLAKNLWSPTYNIAEDEEPSVGLPEFINAIGRAWGDYQDNLGDPAISRKETDDVGIMRVAEPIRALGRPTYK